MDPAMEPDVDELSEVDGPTRTLLSIGPTVVVCAPTLVDCWALETEPELDVLSEVTGPWLLSMAPTVLPPLTALFWAFEAEPLTAPEEDVSWAIAGAAISASTATVVSSVRMFG